MHLNRPAVADGQVEFDAAPIRVIVQNQNYPHPLSPLEKCRWQPIRHFHQLSSKDFGRGEGIGGKDSPSAARSLGDVTPAAHL